MASCAKSSAQKSPTSTKKKAARSLDLSGSDMHALGRIVSGRCSTTLNSDGFQERSDSGQCSYDYHKKEFIVTFQLSSGKTVELNGSKKSFSKWKAQFQIPAMENVAKAKTDSLSVSFPLTLVDGDGTWKGTFSVQTDLVLAHLKRAAGRALTYPGDVAPSGGSSMIFFGKYVKTHGPTEPLSALDYVAFLNSNSRTLGKCTYTKGSEKKRVKRVAYDYKLEVFERRTGKRVGDKRYRAYSPSCPSRLKSNEWVISSTANTKSAFADAQAIIRR